MSCADMSAQRSAARRSTARPQQVKGLACPMSMAGFMERPTSMARSQRSRRRSPGNMKKQGTLRKGAGG